MPTLTVRTRPVRGRVLIFRVMGRYGVMADGEAPVSAWRAYPWSYVVALHPVVVGDTLWVPETDQVRGMCGHDVTLSFAYLNAGKV